MSHSNANNNKIYLFDSDVLIEAKNHYYNPCYAGVFWDWFATGISSGIFRSAVNVKKEFLEGDDGDYLKDFAKDSRFDDFWCDTKSPEIAREFGKLQIWANTQWVANKRTKKTEARLSVALSTFASDKKADAWLVALASNLQQSARKKAFIVTNENSAPEATARVMLPDAARFLNVDVIRLYDLLKEYSGSNFEFMDLI